MRPPMDRIRVLIADDEQSVLDVLTAVMDAESDLEVAASARDAETAIQLATREQPDVAILDVRMPGGGGPRAAREILRRSPSSRVIALSAHEEVDSVLEMLRAGALGYVVKGDSTDAIVKAIHRSLDHKGTFSSQVTGEMELACLRTALLDLERLPEEAYLSLNVSPAMAIAPELHEALDGLPAERLVLEMTEHARVDDYPALKAALGGFRERGVRLA